MKFEFHPDAKIELFHAIEYYEDCEPLLVMTLLLRFAPPSKIFVISLTLGQFWMNQSDGA